VTLATTMAGIMWLGVTLYALFGGADFGAGFWDLIAGNAKQGSRQRGLIEHSIGPVWEANHVWLIFVLVIMWTCFPILFGSITSTLWIPFTLAAFGVIARGSAFAFRKAVVKTWQRRIFGAGFALSSVITPFFFGTIAGAVATGRVPVGVGTGNPLTSWWNPVSIMTGLLAVAVCAYLAGVYLTADARRSGDAALVAQFRKRALAAGVAAGGIAAIGLLLLHQNAPLLAHGLAHRGFPFIVASAVAGVVTLVLLYIDHFAMARVFGAAAVTAVLWGWAAAQYPYVLSSRLTVAQAASEPAVLKATLISLSVGAVLLIPSLAWLYRLFQRSDTSVKHN
jgi:cytochrome bd ubiquinol oxidase subunit II